jgi:hypothetical protein
MSMSYKKALRIAKSVKLNLASAAEGPTIQLSAAERDKLYAKAARKAGPTYQDKYAEDIAIERMLKNMDSSLI